MFEKPRVDVGIRETMKDTGGRKLKVRSRRTDRVRRAYGEVRRNTGGTELKVSTHGTDHEDSDPMFTVEEGPFIESNFALD